MDCPSALRKGRAAALPRGHALGAPLAKGAGQAPPGVSARKEGLRDPAQGGVGSNAGPLGQRRLEVVEDDHVKVPAARPGRPRQRVRPVPFAETCTVRRKGQRRRGMPANALYAEAPSDVILHHLLHATAGRPEVQDFSDGQEVKRVQQGVVGEQGQGEVVLTRTWLGPDHDPGARAANFARWVRHTAASTALHGKGAGAGPVGEARGREK